MGPGCRLLPWLWAALSSILAKPESSSSSCFVPVRLLPRPSPVHTAFQGVRVEWGEGLPGPAAAAEGGTVPAAAASR